MADQPLAAPAPQIQVRVVGQFVKDLSFESPNVSKLLAKQPDNPQLKLELNVNPTQVGPDLYEAALTFKGQAESKIGILYDLEMVYAGIFEVKGAPAEALDAMMHVHCPALLFPFLRRIVADLTREGGFPPLLLDPVDFAQLYIKKRQQLAAAAPSGKPS